jgi:hypothetical protein
MIYLQNLILTLDKQSCVALSGAKNIKNRKAKPKRKKVLKNKEQSLS